MTAKTNAEFDLIHTDEVTAFIRERIEDQIAELRDTLDYIANKPDHWDNEMWKAAMVGFAQKYRDRDDFPSSWDLRD